jgi:anti-sigma factor RsiW
MSPDNCPDQDALSDFVLGKLAIPALEALAQHLDICPECERRVGKLDGDSDAVLSELRRIPGTDPEPVGDPTLVGWIAGSERPLGIGPWGEFRIVREIGRGGMQCRKPSISTGR